VVVMFGGIGGNYDFVCVSWFEWFGVFLWEMLIGVLVHVDGWMFVISE